jgi:hypothetical protein
VSKKVYKCPHCGKRVRHAPYLAMRDRETRREVRFHGAPHVACLEAGAAEAERRGKDAIILHFVYPKSCGDPAGKLDSSGQCFVVSESESIVMAKMED